MHRMAKSANSSSTWGFFTYSDVIEYDIIVALTGLPIGYSVIVALTGIPIGYSVIVALIGLPIGYSVIVALTGLPIEYNVIVALTVRIQCNGYSKPINLFGFVNINISIYIIIVLDLKSIPVLQTLQCSKAIPMTAAGTSNAVATRYGALDRPNQ